jgi:hypothetical protein
MTEKALPIISILMDKLTNEQENAILDKYGEFNITDGKVRLETYLDYRSQPYKKEGNSFD